MDDAFPLVGEAGVRARAQRVDLLLGQPGGRPGEPVGVHLVRAVAVLGDGEDDDLAAAGAEGDLEPDRRAELLEGAADRGVEQPGVARSRQGAGLVDDGKGPGLGGAAAVDQRVVDAPLPGVELVGADRGDPAHEAASGMG
ncbi:hypothetical protein GCM10012278_01440 [Nonomuraea glycinis]|uniref:Uncharacterized protein n=1 Tax=Nonomuraea glycinis TaxID=2047744 RepID=A0A917ZZW0_9ACTN|nr:hypothetical protein GCM10012278_01440 [Nonomuraea glycinis]